MELKSALLPVGREFGVDIALQPDTIFQRAKRLVIFDLDSTLIQTEIIDVGAGANDLPILQRAGLGVAFNSPRCAKPRNTASTRTAWTPSCSCWASRKRMSSHSGQRNSRPARTRGMELAGQEGPRAVLAIGRGLG